MHIYIIEIHRRYRSSFIDEILKRIELDYIQF